MAIEAYHFDFMAEAIREAETGISQGGLRIGAVLTREGKIAAKSWRSNPANEQLWQGDIGD